MPVEIFPKQDVAKDLGSLVKMPGGKHQVTGVHNDFIGVPPTPLHVALWESILASLPPEQHARRNSSADSRFPCMEVIQEGVSEGGRNNQLFHLATMLRRHGVNNENTRLVIESVSGKCEPPVDGQELWALFDSSRTSGPICEQLPAGVRAACGEFCIKERIKGLYVLPGQLRHASPGESVVVHLNSHAGDIVVLEHPDLEQLAKGAVRAPGEKSP